MKLIYCILALFFVLNLSAHDFPTLKRDVEKKLEYSDYKAVVKLVNSHEIPYTESQDTDLQILKIDALINLNLLQEALLVSQTLLGRKLSPEQKANIHVHRELIFELSEDMKKAKREIDAAEAIFNDYPEIRPKNYTYFLIRKSSYNRVTGSTKEAEILAEEARKYAIEHNDKKHFPVIEMLIAFSYRYRNPEFEIMHLKNALQLYKSYHNTNGTAAMYNNIADFYAEEKDFATAEKYIDSGIARSSTLHYINAGLHLNRSRIAELQNKNDEALKYYKIYSELHEKDDEERRDIKLNELDNIYEKKQLENNIESAKKNNLILTIASSVLGLLLLLLTVFYFLLNKRKTEIQAQKINIAQQNDELEKNLQQKQFLVKELNHRVKNNLAVILSLIDFQRDESDDNNRGKFDQLYQRINTISIAHDLYSYSINKSESSLINAKDYISKIFETHKISSTRNFEFENDIADFTLIVDKMLPIGLLLNELITNSIKHANSSEVLKLKFSMQQKQNFLELKYEDNGTEFTVNPEANSLGLFIIEGMVKQIHGNVTRKNSQYIITCPI